MKYEIVKHGSDWDHDELFITNGEKKGLGFIPHENPQEIALVRCPECGRENYSMAVSTGVCSFCGWNVKDLNLNLTS